MLQVWEAQTAEIESALRAAHINAGAPEPLGLITSVRCRIFSDCVLSAQFVTRFILNLHLHEATSILSGPELSLFLLTSAKSAAPLAPASFFSCDEQIHARPVSVSFSAALLATSADGALR